MALTGPCRAKTLGHHQALLRRGWTTYFRLRETFERWAKHLQTRDGLFTDQTLKKLFGRFCSPLIQASTQGFLQLDQLVSARMMIEPEGRVSRLDPNFGLRRARFGKEVRSCLMGRGTAVWLLSPRDFLQVGTVREVLSVWISGKFSGVIIKPPIETSYY